MLATVFQSLLAHKACRFPFKYPAHEYGHVIEGWCYSVSFFQLLFSFNRVFVVERLICPKQQYKTYQVIFMSLFVFYYTTNPHGGVKPHILKHFIS